MLDDRPLALCDSRTVAPSDLIACDRIIPDRVGEVYYLKYNPQHRWCASLLIQDSSELTDYVTRYWLSKQTCFEPFVFVLYDTKGGSHARCTADCPSGRKCSDLLTECSLSTCLFSKSRSTKECSATSQCGNEVHCDYPGVQIRLKSAQVSMCCHVLLLHHSGRLGTGDEKFGRKERLGSRPGTGDGRKGVTARKDF